MTDVTWLPHPRYESYEVSSDGRVRSVDRYRSNRWGGRTWIYGVELKLSMNSKGYLHASICVDGTHINFEVHRFVCEAFHGPPPSADDEARHLNGDSLDNSVENLAWGTASENQRDMIRHGRNRELNKTHCRRGHPYDDANTRINRKGWRDCRECGRLYAQRRRDALKARAFELRCES